MITTYIEPRVQSVTAKTVEVYEASKRAVTPHINKVHEIVDPHFQVCTYYAIQLLVYLLDLLPS